jgi:hypothetical protein
MGGNRTPAVFPCDQASGAREAVSPALVFQKYTNKLQKNSLFQPIAATSPLSAAIEALNQGILHRFGWPGTRPSWFEARGGLYYFKLNLNPQ